MNHPAYGVLRPLGLWLQDFTEPQVEHPKLAAITAQLRERQEAQEAREKEVKTDLVQKAASFLEDFYKVRFWDHYCDNVTSVLSA